MSYTDLVGVAVRIMACEKCSARKTARQPVPPSGDAPNHILVIGEAPGASENRHGEPFIGPAGQSMRTLMAAAGIDLSTVTWANTVQCWPDATPSAEHVTACRTHRMEIIAAVQPRIVIATGKVACFALRPDLASLDMPMGKMRGRPWWWGPGDELDGRCNVWGHTTLVWPVIHPAAGLRSIQAKIDLRDDLIELAQRRYWTDAEWSASFPDECLACGADGWHVDEWGTSFCPNHWTRALTLNGELGSDAGLRVHRRRRA